MTRALASIPLFLFLSGAVFGQSAETRPRFEVADVHGAPKGAASSFKAQIRGDRYEVRGASMLDLIRTAYSADAEKVYGGPNWLEFDRYDVTALVPPSTSQDTMKLMLQSLLADRFRLVVHNDTKPVAGFVLSLGKSKPKLREADVSGNTGCQPQRLPPPPPTPGHTNIPLTSVSCHNMSMEAFAAELKGPAGAGYIINAVLDSTGLKGAWDFEFKFTSRDLLDRAGPDGVTLADAIDKQLGLALTEQKILTPVIVVDRVNETPSDNPSDLAQKLPPPPPAEFEVATIKLSDTSPAVASQTIFGGGYGVLAGGRVNLPGVVWPLKWLIAIAWNLDTLEVDELVKAHGWLDTAKFDVVAKLPANYVSAKGSPTEVEDLGPMLQALLIDRFRMKAHFESQPVTAYALVAAKSKLRRADPSIRAGCRIENRRAVIINGSPSSAPSRDVTCHNITMAQFADQLQSIAGNFFSHPVADATGLEGAWDFSFTFNPLNASQIAQLRNPQGPTAAAADPIGGATIFDAIEKQLGLKLEMRKSALPVLVIDHIEEKPTDN